MRMWQVNPKILCRNHLLGEHNELHMFVGTILKGKSLTGYIKNNLVEVHSIKSRHEELAVEMTRRGYHHQSPLPQFTDYHEGMVDPEKSLAELRLRCKSCKTEGEIK